MIKLKDILNEMGSMTIAPILDLYDQNPESVSRVLFPGKKTRSRDELGIEVEESKERPGLWANIRAKKERGEAPAKKGTKAFKQAVKAAKDINKNTK